MLFSIVQIPRTDKEFEELLNSKSKDGWELKHVVGNCVIFAKEEKIRIPKSDK